MDIARQSHIPEEQVSHHIAVSVPGYPICSIAGIRAAGQFSSMAYWSGYGLLLIALLVCQVPPGWRAMPIPVLLVSLKTLDKGEGLG
jgi:hypothetical protein